VQTRNLFVAIYLPEGTVQAKAKFSKDVSCNSAGISISLSSSFSSF